MFRLSHITVLAAAAGAGARRLRGRRRRERRARSSIAVTPPAPRAQTPEEAARKSAGCLTCHTATDAASMHANPGVVLGCTDCHGGNAEVMAPPASATRTRNTAKLTEQAHVLPTHARDAGTIPSSANPQQSYTLLNKESPEYIRFVNPSDYRVAREACGACHQPIIHAAERSLMATGAMLWGGASYNNGILPYKNYILGEAYTRKGEPAKVESVVKVDRDDEGARRAARHSAAAGLGDGAAGRPVPHLRARRPQHRHASSPRSACPTRSASCSASRSPAGPTSASPTAGRAPACASPSRCSTSPRRGSTTRSPGSSAPTTSPATTAPRAAAPATSSTPTTATRAIPAPTPPSAIGARRRPPTRPSPRTSRAIRSGTSSPAPSRPASA